VAPVLADTTTPLNFDPVWKRYHDKYGSNIDSTLNFEISGTTARLADAMIIARGAGPFATPLPNGLMNWYPPTNDLDLSKTWTVALDGGSLVVRCDGSPVSAAVARWYLLTRSPLIAKELEPYVPGVTQWFQSGLQAGQLIQPKGSVAESRSWDPETLNNALGFAMLPPPIPVYYGGATAIFWRAVTPSLVHRASFTALVELFRASILSPSQTQIAAGSPVTAPTDIAKYSRYSGTQEGITLFGPGMTANRWDELIGIGAD
jgi:hypothetical protein